MRILRTSELIRPGSRGSRETRTVQLRLSGNWLIAAGFRPGQTVYVAEEMGKLTITTEPDGSRQKLDKLVELRYS